MLKSPCLKPLFQVLSLSLCLSLQTSIAAPSVNTGLQAAASRAPVELFSAYPTFTTPSEYARSAIVANLNMRGLALGAKQLTIILPDGDEIVLARSYLEKRGKGDLAWIGWVDGEPDSEVSLTLKRGIVKGRIRRGVDLYELTSSQGQRLAVEKLESAWFPELENDAIPAPLASDSSQGQFVPYAPASSNDAITTIDLLSVYSNDALADAGSVAQMEATIQAAVDAANATFVNSNMSLRYRLVHMAGVNYNTAGSTGDDLPWVRTDADVAILRDQYGADMVSLIVDTPSSCGTGYVQRSPGAGFAAYAFQVTDIDCAVGNLTFAHEHGHNLGMEHNPSNSSADPTTASYPWSFAHFIDGAYRTMMSYSSPCANGCPRAQQVSNPNVSYSGYLTGVSGERDNAQTGEQTGPISAAFRNEMVPLDNSVVFAALGDFGSGSSAEAAVASQVNSWAPDFIITAGDNRYGSNSFDQVIGQFYCAYLTDAGSGSHCNGNGSASNAFFPSPGNHDYTDGGGINEYLNYFTLPGTGISSSGTSGNERYYDVVMGPVHIFLLDSRNARQSSADMLAQQTWLQAQLAASTTPWQVVIFHHAAFSSANHGSDPLMQWPFADWGADVVFGAHDHTYERISMDGIPYFVNGLGGRSIYSFGTPIAGSEVRYNSDYGAMRITANNEQMQFEFINTSGTVIDNHVIVPGGGGNQVVARIAASSDDVEERASDGVLDVTSSDIELGDDPGFNEDQTVGLRFTNLDLPQGAIILSAALEFAVDETDSGPTDVVIRAEVADDAAAFVASTNNVSNRPLTLAAEPWSIPTWGTVGATQQSPDISAVVQEIVDRSGWSANNSMVFVISGGGSRTAESYDGNAALAPLLRIEYELPPPPNGTVDVRLSAASDDVEQKLSDGSMYFDSTDLELGNDPSFNGDQSVGLRFRDIGIPQGATIDTAYLEFNVDETGSTTTDVVIAAQDDDNAAAFLTSPWNLTDRTPTPTTVAWNIPPWSTVGTTQQSPDISAVIQDVVDRAGWRPGNSLVFIISGNGERTAEAYDGVPGSATRLYVEYSTGSVSNTPPTANFSNVCTALSCNFSDQSSDSDGSVVSWSWDFGDGNTSTIQHPGHTYAAAGSYTVDLTVTDDDGVSDNSSQSVNVSAANVAPTADFSAAVTDLSVDFTDLSSDNDGTVVSWSWDFGDGNSTTTQNPSHTYASAGNYTVSLTVTDNDGASDGSSQPVTVTAASLPPSAPSNLTAQVLKVGKGKNAQVVGVELSWTDNANNESHFSIERCLESGKGKNKTCPYAEIGTVGTDVTLFEDNPGDGTFKYRVRAINAEGESAYSNSVKI